MTIPQAIQKAIEGGYEGVATRDAEMPRVTWIGARTPDFLKEVLTKHTADLFLDPLFWQSLGKAMGWENTIEYFRCPDEPEDTDGWVTGKYCMRCGKDMVMFRKDSKKWVEEWHRFIDHLAEGKSIESYFETL